MNDPKTIIIENGDSLKSEPVYVNGPTNPFPEFDKEETEQSIPDRFEQQVKRFSERIAIKSSSCQISYSELNKSANRIAHTLIAQCDETETPVALLMEQGSPQIAAILGGLKAGRFYLSLDPSNPIARNTHMLHDAQARTIVTNNRNYELALEMVKDNQQLLNIDEIDDATSEENLCLPIAPDSLAYILYTSGSTGQPKGVIHNHRNVLHNVMRHTNAYHICAEDRQTLLYTSSVYGGQRDMFNAILNGAALYVYVVKNLGVAHLAEWLIDNEITIYCSVATVFRQLVNTLTGSEIFSTIRLIKLGGEASYKRDVDSYKAHFSSNCLLHCGLGTTETGLARNFFVDKTTTIAGHTVPLGYPVDGMEVLLLDEHDKPVSTGAIGEIAIKSRYVALGYWRKPELTQAVFQFDSTDRETRIYRTGDLGCLHSDGCLVHRGRKDFQVKIRGNRVEIPEIEMALLNRNEIKEAIVIACKDAKNDDILVAYLVASTQAAPNISTLHSCLAKKLPNFMVPSRFVWLDALPLMPNGKVDRKALPAPVGERPDLAHPYAAPQSPLEKKLTEIWADALDLRQIGIHDDFFELGGHSLIAVRITGEIAKLYDQDFPLAIFFEARTIEQLAVSIETKKWSKPWSPLVAIQPNGTNPALFCVHPGGGNVLGYSEFVSYLGEDQPVYGIQAYGVIKGQEPHTCIETMACVYIDAVREVQARGPYYLGGESFGGLVAFEMAQQLIAKGERVAFLFIGDTWLVQGPHFKPLRYYLSFITFPFTIKLKEWINFIARKIRKDKTHRVKVKRYAFSNELHRRNSLAHRLASRNYRPVVYNGKITLFRASKMTRWARQLQHYFGGPAMGWDELATGGVEVHMMPDVHREMMHAENAPGFSNELGGCLIRAQMDNASFSE